jgi:hypothetical protein
LYATTFISRKKWIEHITSQQEALIKKSDVFTLHVLRERFFSAGVRINCVSPCDGGRKMLYGTESGIFMSRVEFNGDKPSVSDPIKLVHITNVTQMDVMGEYNTLLAQSEKTLYSYPLEILESTDAAANQRRSKKVATHINFYKVGLCVGRMLVCAVKSSSNSHVDVLEPFDPQPRGKKQPGFGRLLNKQSEGLKPFKHFSIGAEILSISFLKHKLCVGCTKGFEIVALNTMETESLLDPADTSLDFVIRKEALRPSSIYRLRADFLLNYSDFSFFVNGNGWRVHPEWIIHWEGLPQHFALSYPYLIGFDSNFIEIRHMETTELVRVITGENIRFLHESTREILYVHENENGFDQVVSLDFWEKNDKEKHAGGVEAHTAVSPQPLDPTSLSRPSVDSEGTFPTLLSDSSSQLTQSTATLNP